MKISCEQGYSSKGTISVVCSSSDQLNDELGHCHADNSEDVKSTTETPTTAPLSEDDINGFIISGDVTGLRNALKDQQISVDDGKKYLGLAVQEKQLEIARLIISELETLESLHFQEILSVHLKSNEPDHEISQLLKQMCDELCNDIITEFSTTVDSEHKVELAKRLGVWNPMKDLFDLISKPETTEDDIRQFLKYRQSVKQEFDENTGLSPIGFTIVQNKPVFLELFIDEGFQLTGEKNSDDSLFKFALLKQASKDVLSILLHCEQFCKDCSEEVALYIKAASTIDEVAMGIKATEGFKFDQNKASALEYALENKMQAVIDKLMELEMPCENDCFNLLMALMVENINQDNFEVFDIFAKNYKDSDLEKFIEFGADKINEQNFKTVLSKFPERTFENCKNSICSEHNWKWLMNHVEEISLQRIQTIVGTSFIDHCDKEVAEGQTLLQMVANNDLPSDIFYDLIYNQADINNDLCEQSGIELSKITFEMVKDFNFKCKDETCHERVADILLKEAMESVDKSAHLEFWKEFGFDFNRADEQNFTLISKASSVGNLILIDWLVANGANVNQGQPRAIENAVINGKMDVIEHLAKVEDLEVDSTVLNLAIENGEIWTRLVELFHQKLTKTEDYQMPSNGVALEMVENSIRNSESAVFHVLMEVIQVSGIDEENRQRFIEVAVENDNAEVLEHFITNSDDLPKILASTIVSGSRKCLLFMLERYQTSGILINAKDADGKTMLEIAAENNMDEYAKLLRDFGYDTSRCISNRCFDALDTLPAVALIEKIKEHNEVWIERFQNEHSDWISMKTPSGENALSAAMESENLKLLGQIFEHEDFDVEQNEQAIDFSAKLGNQELLTKLHNKKADLSKCVLEICFQTREVEMVAELMQKVEERNWHWIRRFAAEHEGWALMKDDKGNTALFNAVLSKDPETVQRIASMVPSEVINTPNENGEIALDIAALNRDDAIIEKLISVGSEAGSRCRSRKCIEHFGFNANEIILEAVKNQDLFIIEQILNDNLHIVDNDVAETPFVLACRIQNEDIIDKFLYANIDQVDPSFNGHLECWQKLRNVEDPHVIAFDAIRKRDLVTIERIVGDKLFINCFERQVPERNEKLIELAIKYGNADIVELLLKHGASSESLAHLAVSRQNVPILRVLAQYDNAGFNIEKNGLTPLMIAVHTGNQAVIEELLSMPVVDPKYMNDEKESAYSVAAENLDIRSMDQIRSKIEPEDVNNKDLIEIVGKLWEKSKKVWQKERAFQVMVQLMVHGAEVQSCETEVCIAARQIYIQIQNA